MKVIFSQAKLPRVGDMSNKEYPMWTPYEFDSWLTQVITGLYPHLQEMFGSDLVENEDEQAANARRVREERLYIEYSHHEKTAILTVSVDGECIVVLGDHRVPMIGCFFQGMQATSVGPKENFTVVFHIFDGKIAIPDGMCLGMRSYGMANIADLTGDVARWKKYIQKRNLLAWP